MPCLTVGRGGGKASKINNWYDINLQLFSFHSAFKLSVMNSVTGYVDMLEMILGLIINMMERHVFSLEHKTKLNYSSLTPTTN